MDKARVGDEASASPYSDLRPRWHWYGFFVFKPMGEAEPVVSCRFHTDNYMT